MFRLIGLLIVLAAFVGASPASAYWFTNPPIGSGTKYYVNGTTGSDSNNGTSPATPWLHITSGHATSFGPGDIINVAGSLNNVFAESFSQQGTANAYIEILCAPGSLISVAATNDFQGGIVFASGAQYFVLNGCAVTGANTNAYGISVGVGGTPTANTHHIIIENNTVYGEGEGGIGVGGNQNAPYASDYFAILNNITYNNGARSTFYGSGISSYEPLALDNAGGPHIAIIGNASYYNRNPSPGDTDGNGIIVDDGDHTQATQYGPYIPQTLVADNIVFNNNGRGIHIFNSTNVLVVNNTAWSDGTTTDFCNGPVGAYEIGDTSGGIPPTNTTFVNNLAFATRATNCSATPSMGLDYSLCECNYTSGITNDVFNFNSLYNSAVSGQTFTNLYGSSTNHYYGPGNVIGNPLLANPTAFTTLQTMATIIADFTPTSGSPAIGAGSPLYAYPADISGTARVPTQNSDAGAIEISP